MSAKLRLFIQPNDVLFFRDGRPFDAGGDFTARLAFPPTPVTFYGALRAAILGRNSANFASFASGVDTLSDSARDEAGSADSMGALRISDFGIARRDGAGIITRFFPIPKDVVRRKSSETEPRARERFQILQPRPPDEAIKANLPHPELRLLAIRPSKAGQETDVAFESPGGFLTQAGLSAYLQDGELDSSHFETSGSVFEAEPRIGIRRDNTRFSAEEGYLYALEFARLRDDLAQADFGFIVEINSAVLRTRDDKVRFLRLGGEARSASYQRIDTANWPSLPQPQIADRFKLYFMTPAIFSAGWLPDGIDPATMTGEIGGVKLRLVAAAVDKYTGIGGWDIVRNRAKPVRRAVPAGSVYFFEQPEKRPFDSDQIVEKFSIQSIHGETDLSKQGLGITSIGVW